MWEWILCKGFYYFLCSHLFHVLSTSNHFQLNCFKNHACFKVDVCFIFHGKPTIVWYYPSFGKSFCTHSIFHTYRVWVEYSTGPMNHGWSYYLIQPWLFFRIWNFCRNQTINIMSMYASLSLIASQPLILIRQNSESWPDDPVTFGASGFPTKL